MAYAALQYLPTAAPASAADAGKRDAGDVQTGPRDVRVRRRGERRAAGDEEGKMIEIGIRIDDPLAVSQDKPATVRGDVRAEASGPTGMTGMCMPRPPV